MRKKLIAALGALSLVGGLATILTTAPAAEAYTEASSCLARADYTICTLTTDYTLFDPGSLQGYAVNNLLTLSDHGQPDPGDDNTIAVGQAIYRGFDDPATSPIFDDPQHNNKGQGTAALATIFVPFDQVPDQDAQRIGIIAQQADHQDPDNPSVQQLRFEGAIIDIGGDHPRSKGTNNEGNDPNVPDRMLSIDVSHTMVDATGTAFDYDEFKIAVESFLPEAPGYIGLRFNSVQGCFLALGPLTSDEISLCDDRPQPSDVFVDNGLAPLAPVVFPLDGVLYNSDGELISGTGTALPYQPIPFLPIVPFLILP